MLMNKLLGLMYQVNHFVSESLKKLTLFITDNCDLEEKKVISGDRIINVEV